MTSGTGRSPPSSDLPAGQRFTIEVAVAWLGHGGGYAGLVVVRDGETGAELFTGQTGRDGSAWADRRLAFAAAQGIGRRFVGERLRAAHAGLPTAGG